MYKVERIEAEKFSKVWNRGGISIILTPEAVDFARDFANVVLNNFIQMCQQQALEAQKAEEKAKKPLIIEGV
jgi:hypothetical protein